MAEIHATDLSIATAAARDIAPRKSLWQRFEPTALGAGTIVVLLLAWQFLPEFIPMKAGTKLFFAVPSQIAGTLWTIRRSGRGGPILLAALFAFEIANAPFWPRHSTGDLITTIAYGGVALAGLLVAAPVIFDTRTNEARTTAQARA